MIGSPTVRAARKKAQRARIAAKGSKEYSKLYASQPDQVRIAAEQTAARKVRRAAQLAIENAIGADAAASADSFGNLTTVKSKGVK